MSDELSIWDISTGIQDAVLRIEEAQRVARDLDYDLADGKIVEGTEINAAAVECQVAREALILYLQAEVKKVDACAEYILFCRAQAEAGRAKEKQVGKVAQGWENRAQRIEDAVMYCLRASGSKLEESATHRLRRQGNGGLKPMTIAENHVLPPEFRITTLRLSTADWNSFLTQYPRRALIFQKVSDEPNKKAIREALERNEGVFGCSLSERSERLVIE